MARINPFIIVMAVVIRIEALWLRAALLALLPLPPPPPCLLPLLSLYVGPIK